MKTTSARYLAVVASIAFGFGISNVSSAQNAEAKGPSDAEIAHIVVTANAIDIDAGKLAQSKSKSKAIRDFAKLMVTDHSAVNKQASELAKKLGVTPKDNDVSKSLLAGAKTNTTKLNGLKGAEFDKAYVDNEVAYHEAVLNALDRTLIPSAQNAELKDLMVKVRPAFVAHLEHAKGVQTSLTK